MTITNPPHWIEPGKFKGDKWDKIVEMITVINAGGAPDPHKITHEEGGGDEISVLNLSGLLADGQTPLAHKASHQNGGGDEISVASLSGLLADAQNPLAHTMASHSDEDTYNISTSGLGAHRFGNSKEFTGVKSCSDNVVTPFVRLSLSGGYQNGSDQVLFVKLYLTCEYGDAYAASAGEWTVYSRDAFEAGGPPYWPGQTSVQVVNRADLGSINAGWADMALPTVTATWNSTGVYMEIRVQTDMTGTGGQGASYFARYKIQVLARYIDKVAIAAL